MKTTFCWSLYIKISMYLPLMLIISCYISNFMLSTCAKFSAIFFWGGGWGVAGTEPQISIHRHTHSGVSETGCKLFIPFGVSVFSTWKLGSVGSHCPHTT